MSDELKTEEDVKIKFLLKYLTERGYKENCCDFNKEIEVQEGRKRRSIFADVVVYASPKKKAPLVVCETKAPGEVLDKKVREQAISYARLLPQIAPLALITNGKQVQVYQTVNKNRISDLQHRKEMESDLVNFVISVDLQEALRAEAKHELFIIKDVETFKSILKACHNEIRNNEGYDPTQAFDELSKVLFCKLHEEKERPQNPRFRLSVFDQTLTDLKVNVVKTIFEETKNDSRYSGLFSPDAFIALQDRTIRKIVALFENYDLSLTEFDVKGEAFEYFLGDTFTGGLGEYFTPRNVVEWIVDAIDPRIGNTIVDPFCGTGGFLIYAFEVISDKIRMQEFSDAEKEKWRFQLSNRSLYGTDWKERTSQACKMNMTVHGDGSSGIFKHDGLTDVPGAIEEGNFEICLTNPPFGSFENDPTVLKRYELGAGRNSQSRVVLAVERALRLIRPGGLVGIVVIDGIINNDSMRYVRDYVREHAILKAVVSLAPETFEGYGARAKTSILLLQKKTTPALEQGPVYMAIARNTGYGPTGAPVAGNELPDILLDYRDFIRNGKVASPKHPTSTVAIVIERFDAEFYIGDFSGDDVDLDERAKAVEGVLAGMAASFEALPAELMPLRELSDVATVRVGDVLEEVSDIERLDPEVEYGLLGVRWWGEGVFLRERKLGREISSKSLNRVTAGDVIYNRLFAFKGSFAVIPEDLDGFFVSNEFPTFRVKASVDEPVLVAKYIVHAFNSPASLSLVDRMSTGSTKTSRNRFKEDRFLAFKFPIPTDIATLETIVRGLDRAVRMRREAKDLLEAVKELGEGIGGIVPGPLLD
jgi:type I restriction enzyme M protein